jgi:predicted HTH domain antitoxin
MQNISFEDKYRIEVNESPKDFESDVKKGAALLFFIEEKLTLGQASEMAGMSQYDFMKYASSLGIPVIRYPASELKQEIL